MDRRVARGLAAMGVLAGAMAVADAAAQGKKSFRDDGDGLIEVQVCNRSGRDAQVAISYIQPGESRFINRGWYKVENGDCSVIAKTRNAHFYLYADADDGSGLAWQGDFPICVEYPGPYTFYSSGDDYCGDDQELRQFVAIKSEEPGRHTWNLDP